MGHPSLMGLRRPLSHAGLFFWLLLPAVVVPQDKPEIMQLPLEGKILATLGPIDLSKSSVSPYELPENARNARFIAIRVTTQPEPSWVPDSDLPFKAVVKVTLRAGSEVIVDKEMSLERWLRRPCAVNLYERCFCLPLTMLDGGSASQSPLALTIAVTQPIKSKRQLHCDVVLLSK